MKRLLPAPLLSLALFALWLLLERSTDAADVLLALVLALVLPLATRSLRPLPVRMRRPGVALRLLLRVLADSLASNAAALRLFVAPRLRRHPPGFVRIALDLRDPNALAVLAMIVCITPGTAWAELSIDHRVLMLHVLELDDPVAFVADVKARYERPLMEIFE